MELPQGQSTFLWGARKTGKSSFLKQHYPDSIYYDLLKTDEYFRLLKEPDLLRKEILAAEIEDLQKPIIIDEVQKIPPLLDEVHWLIENSEAYFILCGSSARKLKRDGANLLGGRAKDLKLHPLTQEELGAHFKIQQACQFGTLPKIAQRLVEQDIEEAKSLLRSYITTYIKEEIQAEALTRRHSRGHLRSAWSWQVSPGRLPQDGWRARGGAL